MMNGTRNSPWSTWASGWTHNCHCASEFQSPLLNSDPGMTDKHRTATGLGVSYSAAALRSWANIWMQNYHWDLLSRRPTKNSDPVSADGGRATTWPHCVAAHDRTWIQGTDYWFQMTLSSDEEWNQKQPLTSMGLQMDTELPLGIGVMYHRQTWILGWHVEAELPLGFGVLEHNEELVSRDGRWMQNCFWALVCHILSPKSDPGTADETITANGILCIGAPPGTRIQSTDHWCQMTLISDDKWNCKKNLAYLGQRMDTELPLCLGISEPIVELISLAGR
ncbi:hypothetical protein NN561_019561 [Cricetulus griseus]